MQSLMQQDVPEVFQGSDKESQVCNLLLADDTADDGYSNLHPECRSLHRVTGMNLHKRKGNRENCDLQMMSRRADVQRRNKGTI